MKKDKIIKKSVIPPGSILRLVKCPKDADNGCEDQIGKLCRAGYYCKGCGLGIVWIVDQFGEYVETFDQHDLKDYFEVVKLSDEQDFHGDNRPKFGKIDSADSEWQWTKNKQRL